MYVIVLPLNISLSAAKAGAASKNVSPRVVATKRFSIVSSNRVFQSPGAAASITFGVFDLIEPVETHRLHDAAVDHDDARFVFRIAIEVLMRAIGRDVDEIALAPFEALGLLFPAELHPVIAIKP